MSVTIPLEFSEEMDDILAQMSGYFEGLADMYNSYSSLDEIFDEVPPILQYIWDLETKITKAHDQYNYEQKKRLVDARLVFTPEEIEEMKQKSTELQATAYSDDFKSTLPRLLDEIERIRRVTARAQGRNLLYGKLAGILDPSAKRAGLVGNNRPAMAKALGMEGFATTVGSMLTNAPHIIRESKGTVDAALANLRRRATGNNALPLRKRGTGTGGRRKSHTRKSRSHKGHKATRRTKH